MFELQLRLSAQRLLNLQLPKEDIHWSSRWRLTPHTHSNWIKARPLLLGLQVDSLRPDQS